MKRKQTAEFKPPVQRFVRLTRQNSTESASSADTAEIKLTDPKPIPATINSNVQSAAFLDSSEEHWPQVGLSQCTEKSLNADEHELDSGLFETNSDAKQASVVISGKLVPIKYKPQDGSTSDPVRQPEGAGMEEQVNDVEDKFSPERQTSYAAQSRRCSLDESGDDMLCGDVSGTTVVSVKACGETECLEPPAKKRLRRRMGMCGLGDRKRRFLREGQPCRQALTEAEREEGAVGNVPEEEELHAGTKGTEGTPAVAKETSEHPVDDEEVCYGCIAVTDEDFNQGSKETAEHPVEVPEEQMFGLLGVTNEVCGGSKETANQHAFEGSSNDPVDTERMNYSSTGTDDVSEGSKIIDGCPLAAEVNYGSTDSKELHNGSKEATEGPVDVAEEVRHASVCVTEVCEGSSGSIEHMVDKAVIYGTSSSTGVCEGSVETTEHPVAEEVICGSASVTEPCEGSKDPAECPVEVAEEVSYGSIASEGSTEPTGHPVEVAEEVSYGSIASEGSTEPTGHPVEVAEEVSYGSIASEGSTEPTGHPVEMAKEVSDGSTTNTNKVSEGSTEPTGHPVEVAEEVSYGSTGVTIEVSEGSTELTGHPIEVAKEVSDGSTTSTNKVSEGSTEPTGHPVEVAEEVSYGSTTNTNKVPEGSTEPTGHPVEVAEEVSYGSIASEGSTEPTGHPIEVAKEVSDGSSTSTNKVSEGSTEPTGHPVEVAKEVSDGSTTNTSKVSEGSTEPTGHPVEVAKEVSDGSTTNTSKVSEGSTEPTGHPVEVAKEVSDGSTTSTNKVSEGSTEPTGHPVEVAKEVSYGSTTNTSKVSEDSAELTGHPVEVAREVSYGSTGVTIEVSEGSTELAGHPVEVAEEVSYGSTGVTIEVSEGSTEPAGHLVEVAEEVSYGSTGVTNEVSEGSQEVEECPAAIPEIMRYTSAGVTSAVSEGSINVSKEIQEAISALEESEMDLDITHLFSPYPNLSTVEQNPGGPLHTSMRADSDSEVEPVCMALTVTGLTASTEAAFSEICETEVPQIPTTAAPGRTEPGGKCTSSTAWMSLPEAPPTDQENCMQALLGQDICDPPVIPAVAKQPISNPALTLVSAEFSQEHNSIPSSLYSVTDSQLNSIVLGIELEDQPTPVDFVHQEDATELVRGLIKELSSLNRTVMAAHKEIELLRRGSRPPKPPIRRTCCLRSSEI